MLVSAIRSTTTPKPGLIHLNNLKKVQPSFLQSPDKNKYPYSDIAGAGVIVIILLDYVLAYGNFQGDIVTSMTSLYKMFTGLH